MKSCVFRSTHCITSGYTHAWYGRKPVIIRLMPQALNQIGLIQSLVGGIDIGHLAKIVVADAAAGEVV